jgi:superfamily I DNA/RNA helicase
MIIKPTEEQLRIFKFGQKRNENLLIQAYAGAAKTTTLVELINYLPNDKSTLFIAFNKHIQQESKERLPDHVRCYTSHGLGMSALKRKYGESIVFDEFKLDKWIQKKSKNWDLNSDFKSDEEVQRYLNNFKKLVNLCRLSLTLDKKYIPFVAERHDIILKQDRDIPRLLKVLDSMTQDRKIFDYTDMVYLPAVDNSIWLFPQDYVLVDECLPYDTKISTNIDNKRIGVLCNMFKQNKELPDVVSYNENTKTFELKKIKKVWCTGKKDIYYVVLNGKRKIKSTVNHRFLTSSGWKRLDELIVGDNILCKHNESSNLGCMIVSETMKYFGNENTYDMEVEDNHNFIITPTTTTKGIAGNYGIIAHNCQDVSNSQFRLIEKSLKRDKISKKYTGRLISCGDFFQNIYGFTGADERSYSKFEKFPNTKKLPLSISFRCSKKVIEHAQKIVPDIRARDNAPDGDVRNGNVLEEAQDGDFVLCRTTTPLIKLFFEFLSQKKKAIIRGSDIGLQIIQLIGNFKTISELTKYWEGEINDFRNNLTRSGILNPQEHSGFVALEDKVNTILFLSKVSETIEDLKHNIETIFTDKLQGIVLSTIHKAKGLEANRVFIIRPDKLPLPGVKGWQYAQEKNLEYVAITRAKEELIYDRDWTDEK